MAESGLPRGWEVRKSKSKNMPYYFNTTTQESKWDPPQDTDTEKLKAFIATYYTEQPSDQAMSSGDGKIRARHFLVKHSGSRNPKSWKEPSITRSKAEAKSILSAYERQIREGEKTLKDVVVTESDCPSHSKHGDLGFFSRDQMQAEFSEAAFALQPGEMSGIVDTASGLHLIERIA